MAERHRQNRADPEQYVASKQQREGGFNLQGQSYNQANHGHSHEHKYKRASPFHEGHHASFKSSRSSLPKYSSKV